MEMIRLGDLAINMEYLILCEKVTDQGGTQVILESGIIRAIAPKHVASLWRRIDALHHAAEEGVEVEITPRARIADRPASPAPPDLPASGRTPGKRRSSRRK